MQKDSTGLVQKCDKCQIFEHVPKTTLQATLSRHQPMANHKVGNRTDRPTPYRSGQAKFAIVAIDYFTKYVQAKPLSTITETKYTNSYGETSSVDLGSLTQSLLTI